MSEPILIAKTSSGNTALELLPQMANRHGLIAGATGTGKTVTLQSLAQGFSARGIPVFMADVKGDLAGLSQPAGENPKVAQRVAQLGLDGFAPQAAPVVFWDVYGETGHPVRATISDMGPLLLGRLLNLNEVQAGVLTIVFKVADDQGLLLLDLKDLRSMIQHVGDNAAQFNTEYGKVSAASIGAIQRGLLELEQQGADRLFGEPALDLDDLMQTDSKGHGVVNILSADRLMHSPKLYSTLLLWLMSELFENLPEVGDIEKPKLVFFFDEAHLLFNDAPKALLEKIEQVVRLIRSKGVGIYFVSQNPLDIPDVVLGQLGNRVQHALRAFTPRDQKAVRSAAETFRANPALDVESVITELGVGEALISLLDAKGTLGVVERAFVVPPQSHLGAVSPDQRQAVIRQSLVRDFYEKTVDRDSAYEMLKARAEKAAPPPEEAPPPLPAEPQAPGRQRESLMEAAAKSAVRAASSQLGRTLIRGVLGGLVGAAIGGAARSTRRRTSRSIW